MICHGDFGRWNLVWRGSRSLGTIGWGYAFPAGRMQDIAYSLECLALFRDDTERLRSLRYRDWRHRAGGSPPRAA